MAAPQFRCRWAPFALGQRSVGLHNTRQPTSLVQSAWKVARDLEQPLTKACRKKKLRREAAINGGPELSLPKGAGRSCGGLGAP